MEIGVEDKARLLADHPEPWRLVTTAFESKLCIRDVAWEKDQRPIVPPMVRFLETPVTNSEYVYLTDIDYIILEEITPVHLEIMRENQARYSNIIRSRPGRPQLSGLHFTKRAAHYPLPDISDVRIRTMGDEELLYEIVRRKGTRLYKGDRRPQHGIHISPQRSAVPTISQSGERIPGWSIPAFAEQFHLFIASDLMTHLRPTLSTRIQRSLEEIEEVCAQVLSVS